MTESTINNEAAVLIGDDIRLWADDDRAIHLKVGSPYGDPVELSAEEAKELAGHLLRLADRLE
jgi:hypothetical protein